MAWLRTISAVAVLLGGCAGDSGSADDDTTSSEGPSTGAMSTSAMTGNPTTSTTGGDDTSTGAATGSSDGSAGASSSGGIHPTFYTECARSPQCDPCICNTFVRFCTIPCRDADECPVPMTGTAIPICSMTTTTCVLSCTGGEECPDGMTCNGVPDAMFCEF